MQPIYHEALLLLSAEPGSRLGKAVMQALAQLNRLASNALLTGGVTPVTAAALLGGLGWVEWLTLMAVPIYAMLILGAVAVNLTSRAFEQPCPPPAPERSERPIDHPSRASTASSERPSWRLCTEARACAILLVTSALWLTDSWHGLDPAVAALFGAVLVVTPGIGVVSWSQVERGVGVGLVFVIAASLTLAHTVQVTGAAAWLGTLLVAGLLRLRFGLGGG